jgi:tetratricopeptide (TPR) repeat protein
MSEWISLVSAAGAGVAASLASSWIKNRLKRKKEIVYDVAFPSGQRQEVKVSKSLANDADSSVQEALFGALNLMRGDQIDSRSRDQLKQFVTELERQRRLVPLSRRLVLILGRAYRLLAEPQKAIEILTEYIAIKERDQQLDSDLGDAYYNLACYLALDGNYASAMENLRRAIRLNPQHIEDARVDPDLSSVRDQLREILADIPNT